ncbi:carboxymuconolactone decarboxylase family protein [Mycetocola sp. 2940]|uniref:carboxymuconolactone decarboxylase family protein n=1 Tax=Mycetocola sp. 2940 TaxID=3156452 RepID=UPI003392220C
MSGKPPGCSPSSTPSWGEIWTRPGLDRRTRSFLSIASLVTGGHEHELAMHVRAAGCRRVLTLAASARDKEKALR